MRLQRRIFELETRYSALQPEVMGQLFAGRSDDELAFLAAHGWWPDRAPENFTGRTERSFTVNGMKTTVILERGEQPEQVQKQGNAAGKTEQARRKTGVAIARDSSMASPGN